MFRTKKVKRGLIFKIKIILLNWIFINKIKKMIKRVRPALNVLLFTLLFKISNLLIPEYSSLIICNPARPSIMGNIKLILPGKKDVKFILKKLLVKTSKILIETSDKPIIKYF